MDLFIFHDTNIKECSRNEAFFLKYKVILDWSRIVVTDITFCHSMGLDWNRLFTDYV